MTSISISSDPARLSAQSTQQSNTQKHIPPLPEKTVSSHKDNATKKKEVLRGYTVAHRKRAQDTQYILYQSLPHPTIRVRGDGVAGSTQEAAAAAAQDTALGERLTTGSDVRP
jgi:hypothetical protein